VGVEADPDPTPAERRVPLLKRLLPPGEPATVQEVVEGFALCDRPAVTGRRPFVMLNMVSTVDGRATLDGSSGRIGGSADRELFHELRATADAVMAGAGTVRAERYGRITRGQERARRRRERGLSEEPLACIVSTSLSLPPDLPLLGDPAARVVIVTPSAASLPASAAHIDYVRAQRDGRLDLPAALSELRERLQVRTLLCEGGPHLAAQLLTAALVDELFLTLSPKLAGGAGPSEEDLRILAGRGLGSPIELELLSLLASGSYLFVRYGVCSETSPARV